ncbi:hypothetical protein Tco_0166223 [Tanacetum coccineum]
MPVSRQHCSKHFMDESVDHLFAGPKLEILNLRTGPEIMQETTEKIVQIQQRSYANVKRKPLEFQVGDRVMLKVSPRKGIFRLGK